MPLKDRALVIMVRKSRLPLSRTFCRIATACVAVAPGVSGAQQPKPRASHLSLDVDARDVMRGIQRAHMMVPVSPGPLTLVYPKWIPGEHRANGPITQMTNLRISAQGRPLPWRRDPADAFSFRIIVPNGATALDVTFDYVSPASAFGSGFGKSPNVTPTIEWILFNHLLLYPAGVPSDALRVEARVRLPDGWRSDSALPLQVDKDGWAASARVSLTTLVDSPILAGAYLKTVDLPGTAPPARITLAADSAKLADGQPVPTAALSKLVEQAERLAGKANFGRYVWLVALNDTFNHDGLEHSASSDVREGPDFFTDPHMRYQWSVLAHEFFHAWNGKFRRPIGLATPDYQQRMSDEMLWVYEGLTRYYGDVVLPARSGLATHQEIRDYLAYAAAQISRGRPGRDWRSLADTAIAVPDFGDAPSDGLSARRGADYYNEMLFVWLEADMLIRQRSGGRHSLDDFCRRFLAHGPNDASIKPYRREDVARILHSIADVDWETFFHDRIDAIAPAAPLGGLRAAGWDVAYDDTVNPFSADVERGGGVDNFSTSLGFLAAKTGQLIDVVRDSPAYEAGIAPGAQVIEVDGRPWSPEALKTALLAHEDAIRLKVKSDATTRDLAVSGTHGLQIPHLRRLSGKQDALSTIFAPIAAP